MKVTVTFDKKEAKKAANRFKQTALLGYNISAAVAVKAKDKLVQEGGTIYSFLKLKAQQCVEDAKNQE